MMLNATFNTMSAISWRSVLLVKKATNPEYQRRKPQIYRKSLTNYILYIVGNSWEQKLQAKIKSNILDFSARI
jgi:hypothetical protein